MTDTGGGWDAQDQAEVFDEDNQTLDEPGGPAAEAQTFEELPEVFDATAAVGDAADDDALIGEDLDDAAIVDLEENDDSEDLAALPEEADEADPAAGSARDEADLVYLDDVEAIAADADDAADLEAERLSDDDLEALGYRGTEQ